MSEFVNDKDYWFKKDDWEVKYVVPVLHQSPEEIKDRLEENETVTIEGEVSVSDDGLEDYDGEVINRESSIDIRIKDYFVLENNNDKSVRYTPLYERAENQYEKSKIEKTLKDEYDEIHSPVRQYRKTINLENINDDGDVEIDGKVYTHRSLINSVGFSSRNNFYKRILKKQLRFISGMISVILNNS